MAVQKKQKNNSPLISVLETLSIQYSAPFTPEQCRSNQGSKLPFDAIIFVDGRSGLIMCDARDHFAPGPDANHDVVEEYKQQQVRDRIRNCYARDAKLSLLRIATHVADIKTPLVTFVAALKQNATEPVVMLSNPELYLDIYGDGTMPKISIIKTVHEDYSAATASAPVAASIAKEVAPVTIPVAIAENKPISVNNSVSAQPAVTPVVQPAVASPEKTSTNATTNTTAVVSVQPAAKTAKTTTGRCLVQ